MVLGKVISITSLAILAIIFVVGGVGFQLVTSQPAFCTSCHEMNFYYNSWKNSTHGTKAVCLNCHSEPGLQGFIGEKVRGAEQLAAHISGNYKLPIQIITRVKNNQCLACHPETRNLTDKTIQAKHALHMDKSVLCADCHNRIIHNQSGQPRVVAQDQCDKCHKAHTNFKLLGVHATLNCENCHPGNKYRNIDPNCESCHEVPGNHIAGVVGNCDKCHSPAGWKPATFDHSKFPLTGRHQSLTCEQCHNGNYNGTAMGCISCHKPPSSHAGMEDTDCIHCHNR
jgi:cytochrome c nitrite reductase small subunit